MNGKKIRNVRSYLIDDLHGCGVADANVRALDLCSRSDGRWVDFADD